MNIEIRVNNPVVNVTVTDIPAVTNNVSNPSMVVNSSGIIGPQGIQGPPGEQGPPGGQGPPGEPAPLPSQANGSLITFDAPKIFNSPDSPATNNLTDDLTDSKIGIVQKIYHSSNTAPTFPAGWVKLGTTDYVEGSLNIIFAEWITASRVEYWII